MTNTLVFEYFTADGEVHETVKQGVESMSISIVFRDVSDALGMIGTRVSQCHIIPTSTDTFTTTRKSMEFKE